MIRKDLGLLMALLFSISAHAQLTTVDGGAAVEDSTGLMFANDVLSAGGMSVAQPVGQAYAAGLDAENYGGYNDWTLITVPQAAQLFQIDCLNNGCAAFTTLTAVSTFDWVFPTSTPTPLLDCPPDIVKQQGACPAGYWLYEPGPSLTGGSAFQPIFDSTYSETFIAVREAPELNAGTAAAGLTLLLGAIAIRRERRN